MVFPYAPEHAAPSREVGGTTPITAQETAKNITQEMILALLKMEPTVKEKTL